MQVVINGEAKAVREGVTLGALLEELGLKEKVMAAAVNMQIVKQAAWQEHLLHDGDKLELLDFVGGG